MNNFDWELNVQRRQEMMRQVDAARLRRMAWSMMWRRRWMRVLHVYHRMSAWLRNRQSTGYNDNLETARRVPPVARADHP